MTSDQHASPFRGKPLNFAALRVDMSSVTETPAPKITTAHIRLALTSRHGVVVQDLRSGMVIAMPAGLSKTEANDPDLCVLLTNAQAQSFLDLVGGSYTDAAKSATAVIAFEMQMIDARLAAYAAKGEQH